jgi:hypothetical protein
MNKLEKQKCMHGDENECQKMCQNTVKKEREKSVQN